MNWRIEPTTDIAACHALRRAVFIEEQGFSEADEWDDLDAGAFQLLAFVKGSAVGTARIIIDGKTGRIGRICVLKSQRGTGLGAAVVQAGIDYLKQDIRVDCIVLGAQEYAIGFYEKLGFQVCGPIYDDGGVPHREMEITL